MEVFAQTVQPGVFPSVSPRSEPCILQKTNLFIANLDHYASTGEEFLLDTLCSNLTFDIIGQKIKPSFIHPNLVC